MRRRLALSIILACIFAAIVCLFWYQEGKYILPTPLPENYRVVVPGEVIHYDTALIPQQHKKPILLHFFNPDCPCSRFNSKHFYSLQRTYKDQIDFFVVVESQEKVQPARKLIQTDVTILVDADERLAKICGVYSTPQAALIQTNNQLYYRGNYNRARYCTAKNTNYVEMALDSIVANKQAPYFGELATISYGCSLHEEDYIFDLP